MHDGTPHWTNDPEWRTHQNYVGDSAVLRTELHRNNMNLEFFDFVPPHLPVFVRRVRITSDTEFSGKLFCYVDLNVCERTEKNAAYYSKPMFVQYWHKHYIGVLPSLPPDEWQVGKLLHRMWWVDARQEIEEGRLGRLLENLGNVNAGLGWRLELSPNDVFELYLYVGYAEKRGIVESTLQGIEFKPLLKRTLDYWRGIMSCLSPPSSVSHLPVSDLSLSYKKLYNRSIITLHLLLDSGGGFIACPEFDHYYEVSGGYGYCWNRDGVEMARALWKAGFEHPLISFLSWCKRTQLLNGSWFQRYWLDGEPAPSWGNFEHSTQFDETASTVHLMAKYALSLPEERKKSFMRSYGGCIEKACDYLMEKTSDTLHDPCIDLWESSYGVFTYTTASIIAALRDAGTFMGREDWVEKSERLREGMEELWLGDYYAKGVVDEELCEEVDASILGTITPFEIIERDRALKVVDSVERNLGVETARGRAIKRYESDVYVGGNPWVVTTLWLAKAMLKLGLRDRAMEYMEWASKTTTSSGLLAEQVNLNGEPVWAIPLGWSCSEFIECFIEATQHVRV